VKPSRFDWPRALASLGRRPRLLLALALALVPLLLLVDGPGWSLVLPALLAGAALGAFGARRPRPPSRLDVAAPEEEALAPDARVALLEGLRLALGASHLALYRADPPEPGYRLVVCSCREGRARARLAPNEGIVPLLARAPAGRVRLHASELRPLQLPLVGAEPIGGDVALRLFEAGRVRGLWFVADAPPEGDGRLAALDRAQAALLSLDAVQRRADTLATWNQVLGILVRFATTLHDLDTPEDAVTHVGDLLDRVLGAHRLAVLEIAGERGGEIRRVALHPAEAWPEEWPQPEPLPREGFGPLSGLEARARAEVLLPDEARGWFGREGAWYVEGVVPSPLLRLVYVLQVADARAVASTEVRAVVGLALRQSAEHLHDLVVIERLRGFAIVDALTGAYNKRYFQSRLAEVSVALEGAQGDERLTLEACRDRLAACPPPLVAGEPDFLRPDAWLAVVFVSDEEDCSDQDDNPLSLNDTKKCRFLTDNLIPVSELAQSYRSLTADPARVLVASVVGDAQIDGADSCLLPDFCTRTLALEACACYGEGDKTACPALLQGDGQQTVCRAACRQEPDWEARRLAWCLDEPPTDWCNPAAQAPQQRDCLLLDALIARYDEKIALTEPLLEADPGALHPDALACVNRLDALNQEREALRAERVQCAQALAEELAYRVSCVDTCLSRPPHTAGCSAQVEECACYAPGEATSGPCAQALADEPAYRRQCQRACFLKTAEAAANVPLAAPSVCQSRDGRADLGARYLDFTAAFGTNGFARNICAADQFGEAFVSIATTIRRRLGSL